MKQMIFHVVISSSLRKAKAALPNEIYIGRFPQKMSYEEIDRRNCETAMFYGKECECGKHSMTKSQIEDDAFQEKEDILYYKKTLESIKADSDLIIQNRNEDGEWIDCNSFEEIDFYSCMLFRNGKHIPIPMLENALSDIPWKSLSFQEKIIRAEREKLSPELIQKIKDIIEYATREG